MTLITRTRQYLLICALLLCASMGQADDRRLAFDEGFAMDLETQWLASIDDQDGLGRLLRAARSLFEFSPKPRFAGLSNDLYRLADGLVAQEKLLAASQTLELACIVDECGLDVELVRVRVAWQLGDYYGAAGHVSSLFQKSSMIFSALGDPLPSSALLALSMVVGCVLFWCLMLLKYLYGFGAALKGTTELFPAWLAGLIPIGLSITFLGLGYGPASFFVGVLLVIPIMSNMERWAVAVSIGCLTLGVVCADLSSQKDRKDSSTVSSVGLRADMHSLYRSQAAVTQRFSVSTHEELLVDTFPDRERVERVVSSLLRFGDADAVLKIMRRLRAASRSALVVDHDEGLLNSEGIAFGILGEMDEALKSFEDSSRANPERFEPVYNAFLVMKGMGRDGEAQAYLNRSLSLDSKAVGARVAEAKMGDIEGFVYLDSTRWWRQDWGAVVVEGAKAACLEVAKVLDASARYVYGLFLLACVALLCSLILERRANYFFGCPSCGKPTAQPRSVYLESPLLCECCRLDVATASSIERSDLHRHEARVRRWEGSQKLVSVVSLLLFPIYRYVLGDAPMRALLLCFCFVLSGSGVLSSLYLGFERGAAFYVNLVIFMMLYLVAFLGARQVGRR